MSRKHHAGSAAFQPAATGHSLKAENSPKKKGGSLNSGSLRFIDLFCGIGGFRFAVESAARRIGLSAQCVFSSDIDNQCQKAYAANFTESPAGDITQIPSEAVPAHDLLLAGFPCQPFSIIGKMRGFEDTRGTLFFDIARILEE